MQPKETHSREGVGEDELVDGKGQVAAFLVDLAAGGEDGGVDFAPMCAGAVEQSLLADAEARGVLANDLIKP